MEESFARIFYRNCIATGELYPIESEFRLCDDFSTGDTVEIDLQKATLRSAGSSSMLPLRDLGEAGEVISAGGLFAYARKTGLVAERRSA